MVLIQQIASDNDDYFAMIYFDQGHDECIDIFAKSKSALIWRTTLNPIGDSLAVFRVQIYAEYHMVILYSFWPDYQEEKLQEPQNAVCVSFYDLNAKNSKDQFITASIIKGYFILHYLHPYGTTFFTSKFMCNTRWYHTEDVTYQIPFTSFYAIIQFLEAELPYQDEIKKTLWRRIIHHLCDLKI